MTAFPPRIDVLGTALSKTSIDEVASLVASPPEAGVTVAICNVHSVMTARRSPVLAAALADADVSTTDGMPLVWAVRALDGGDQERVTGIDVAARVIERGVTQGLAHFFYGSTTETLDLMVSQLEEQFPGITIAGTLSPPFRELSSQELDSHVDQIRSSGAQVVWVGLGMPKQELWMAKVRDRLPSTSLIGIGAAFDWMAGSMTRAPEWMQRAGLEWVYRLAREPRRLWRRYIFNNPAYLVLLGMEIIRRRFRAGVPVNRR